MICTEQDEKGKMKKEKGEGEKAAGCPPGRKLKITNLGH